MTSTSTTTLKKKASHTPGPWYRDDDGFIAAGAGDSYLTVASPNCTLDLDLDEREANARLITAAPDLLEALDYLLAQTVDQDLKYGVTLTEGEAEAQARALAAIAKARAV